MTRILILLAVFVGSTALASINPYAFESVEQEARFQALITELRCPKCQNQTIADSDAGLARDLKDKVYSMMQQGESDEAIMQFMVERYGYFVVYQPPVQRSTWLLWFGPLVFLLGGALAVVMVSRHSRQSGQDPLNDSAQAQFEELMRKDTTKE